MATRTVMIRARTIAAILSAGLIAAACGADTETASNAPTTVASVGPTAAPSDGPSAPPASAGAGTQTDTEWGRIWDDVPPGFPTYPGSAVADDASPDPVSATYAVAGGDPTEIAAWMRSALETARFRTESLQGPLENGDYVLEAVGAGDCRVQVAVAPMGGLVFVTVRYGAACPAA